MDLEQFYTDVSAALKRGASQDGNIPRWARQACRFHERNIDFQYMLRAGEVIEVDHTAETSNVITLPPRVKNIELLQPFLEGASGKLAYAALPRVERRVVDPYVVAWPTGYWLLGGTLVLDAIPGETFSLDLLYYEYTDWPTDTGAEPDMLQLYEDLLFRETLYQAWIELKDNEAAATWKTLRDESLQTVLAAEENNRYKGQRLAMNNAGRNLVVRRYGRVG